MIVKNLWLRKARTLLTALGIAIGVAAVVALSAFGEGFASGFEGSFSSAGADLTVAQKDALMALISAVDEEVGSEVKQVGGVEEVAGTVIGILQMPDVPYFMVKGEEPRGFAMRHYRIVDGRGLSSRKEILLGKTTAKNFKKQVGHTFRVHDVNYRVVGIYETGVNFEDAGAVMSLADAQRAFDKRGQVSYFNVKVKDPRRIDQVKKDIESRLPEVAATRSGESSTQTEILNMYRSFGWFLGIFAILVGGLGMMNTMLMNVFERRREIGVLRAVGWRRRRVIGLIAGESMVLALSGGILGIIMGIGLTQAARLSPAVESLLAGALTPGVLLQAMVIALLLGTVGGFYPAWRAAQLTPIEAMRYEGGAEGGSGWVAARLSSFSGTNVLRSLLRRPTRTVVTVLSVGIGVGFIVALIAVADGAVASYIQLANAGQADLMAQQAKASDVTFSVIDERVAEQIRREPEVRAVSKLILGMTSVPGLPYFIVFGLDPTEDYAKHYRIREGRLIEKSREIMIGRFAANGLKKGVGDTIRIAGSTYRVVGIFENGSVYEDAGGTMVLKDAQQLFRKSRQVSCLGIGVTDAERADQIAQRLENDYPDLMVMKATSMTERMQDFQMMQGMINALIFLTIIIGGVVMTNAMLMSVFERTQEIGVLRALGWRRRRVLSMVLAESLALSLLSTAIGAIIGVSLCYALMLEPTFGYYLTPLFSPGLFAQTLALALVLGAIGGLYPAWRASGLQPMEALRHE